MRKRKGKADRLQGITQNKENNVIYMVEWAQKAMKSMAP